MRRLISITAFALFLTVPVWAQHGGGHGGGGGGHASFGGGHAGGSFGGHSGFSGGGHVSSGFHVSPGFSRGSASGFSSRSRQPFLHSGMNASRFNSRFGNRDRFRFNNFRNNFRGRNRFGYPYWGWGYYDPWLWDWWDSNNSYNNDYDQDLSAANEMNEQSLEQQQMLRQEEADGDQDAYAPPRRPPNDRPSAYDRPSSEKQGDPVLPPTVLVYRDQHKQEIQNYAIIGQTLWNFAPQHTQKIPLSNLDLTATIKANEDQGITFRVPSSNEAQ
jgi:hypothetical protein